MIEPGKKVAIIMNAGDIYGDEMRPIYLAKEVKKFRDWGFQAEELDLRDYFENPDKLKGTLNQYGAVWVMGGNSFLLRRAMRYSGFDKHILPMVESEAIVYAGFSAGSVVATKTLRGIDIIDDPEQIPPGYSSEVIWEGLGLVNFSIAPHYKSEHPESDMVDKVVDYFEANNMPRKAIRDGQAIIVLGSQIETVE